MTDMIAKCARIGLVILGAAILTAGLCGDAVARAHKGRLHVHSYHGSSYESRAQLVTPAPAQPGPMRYYGGPKSPMGRGN
jgi:hypothetical protein